MKRAACRKNREGLGITVSYWESLEVIGNWKQNAEHQEAQRLNSISLT